MDAYDSIHPLPAQWLRDSALAHFALWSLLGFDLCPRLKELKQRHLYVPRGTVIPPEIAAVCEATVDTALIEKHWDTLVHLAASVMSGNARAVAALARFGSAARGVTDRHIGSTP